MPTPKIETFQINVPVDIYIIRYTNFVLISFNKEFQPEWKHEHSDEDEVYVEPFAVDRQYFDDQVTEHPDDFSWIQTIPSNLHYFAYVRDYLLDYVDGYHLEFEGNYSYPLKDALDAGEEDRLAQEHADFNYLLFRSGKPIKKGIILTFFSGVYDLKKLQIRLAENEQFIDFNIFNTPNHHRKSGERYLECIYLPTDEQWKEWMKDGHDTNYPDVDDLEVLCKKTLPEIAHCQK